MLLDFSDQLQVSVRTYFHDFLFVIGGIFSAPRPSPGRAVVLPPASALALAPELAAASALAKC